MTEDLDGARFSLDNKASYMTSKSKEIAGVLGANGIKSYNPSIDHRLPRPEKAVKISEFSHNKSGLSTLGFELHRLPQEQVQKLAEIFEDLGYKVMIDPKYNDFLRLIPSESENISRTTVRELK